jgi:GNAT superfamily N-acetyltransferase
MAPRIRPFHPDDRRAVVDLSLRAWAPVFPAVAQVLAGSGVYEALHPDWREDQRRAVQAVCADDGMHVWMAEVDAAVAGFVAARLDRDSRLGEIYMLAVDPAFQRRGVGSALTAFASTWLADQGMTVAMIDTGADPGHAPARRVYEQAGYTALPGVKYFKKL